MFKYWHVSLYKVVHPLVPPENWTPLRRWPYRKNKKYFCLFFILVVNKLFMRRTDGLLFPREDDRMTLTIPNFELQSIFIGKMFISINAANCFRKNCYKPPNKNGKWNKKWCQHTHDDGRVERFQLFGPIVYLEKKNPWCEGHCFFFLWIIEFLAGTHATQSNCWRTRIALTNTL